MINDRRVLAHATNAIIVNCSRGPVIDTKAWCGRSTQKSPAVR
jgi:phosphoglycerate dehydrogenase-like enzyme